MDEEESPIVPPVYSGYDYRPAPAEEDRVHRETLRSILGIEATGIENAVLELPRPLSMKLVGPTLKNLAQGAGMREFGVVVDGVHPNFFQQFQIGRVPALLRTCVMTAHIDAVNREIVGVRATAIVAVASHAVAGSWREVQKSTIISGTQSHVPHRAFVYARPYLACFRRNHRCLGLNIYLVGHLPDTQLDINTELYCGFQND